MPDKPKPPLTPPQAPARHRGTRSRFGRTIREQLADRSRALCGIGDEFKHLAALAKLESTTQVRKPMISINFASVLALSWIWISLRKLAASLRQHCGAGSAAPPTEAERNGGGEKKNQQR